VNSRMLDNCILEVVREMVFPMSATGASTRVIYPFVFQARGN